MIDTTTDIATAGLLSLHFGPLADPLETQLARQGLRLPLADGEGRELLGELQRDADCATRLYVRGLLSKAQTRMVRELVFRRVKLLFLASPSPSKRARKARKER